MSAPLAGITVLALEQAIAAPLGNHGKESADLEVFTRLLDRADVLVSNLAPGALGPVERPVTPQTPEPALPAATPIRAQP